MASSLKKNYHQSRVCDRQTMRCNLLEAIAQEHGGIVVSRCNVGGGTRMKIVVRKQDLKQMLAMMESGKNKTHQASSSSSSPTTLDRWLHAMRKLYFKRLDQVKRKCSQWRPALESIPEEE